MNPANKQKVYPSKKKRNRSRRRSGWLPLAMVGGLLVIVAALLALGNTSLKGSRVPVTVSGKPELKVDQEKVDLGDVKFDTPAEVTFTLSNVGDKTLRFTREPRIEVLDGC